MSAEFRCNCPITSAIDLMGDKWSLVVVKNMLLYNQKTFKDFSEASENIATNILSSRLKRLEQNGFITKTKPLNNKKTNIYLLTEKGLSLIPIIVELAIWGDANIHIPLSQEAENGQIAVINNDKESFIKNLKKSYKEKIEAID
ncbi:helix-turn-helix transcriptional regulator [Crocinitomicaceae bacterium]|nr:helix-turn-helix transcriptional regulator [Crocinitomicaceae bacterium]